MSDKDSSFFYDKGHEVAGLAEHGDLSGANKEIQDFRSQQNLKPSEYNALLNSIKGANAMDMHNEDRQVADYNQHKWFFQSEAKPILPQLTIDGADSKTPISGYTGRDGLKQPAVENPTPVAPQQAASVEGPVVPMINPDTTDKVFNDTLSAPKTH